MIVALDIQIPPFDFAKALREIVDSGMTAAEVARTLNVPRMTLERWMAGSHPRWHHGVAIQQLLLARRTQVRNT